jgi:hypothetical protein
MNSRQQRFADEFLKSGNASQAAVAAGYSPGAAGGQGFRLLKNEQVREYIGSRLGEMSRSTIANAEEVMRFLSDVMRGAVKDQFGLDASLADRLTAARELLRRLDVANGQTDTLARLDGLLIEFRAALAVGADDDNQDVPTGARKDEQ